MNQYPYGNNQYPHDNARMHGYPLAPEYPLPYPPLPEKKPNTVISAIAFACGVYAMTLPVPVLDIILGIVGIILAAVAMRGQTKGLAIAGLVVSILGTFFALSYTAVVLGWIDTTALMIHRL